jgi:hypothetical protein
MKVVLALAAGYMIGARTGSEHFDDILRSLRAVRDSEEFQELIVNIRSHAGSTLRELAALVEHPSDAAGGDATISGDLVARVRDLAGLR